MTILMEKNMKSDYCVDCKWRTELSCCRNPKNVKGKERVFGTPLYKLSLCIEQRL